MKKIKAKLMNKQDIQRSITRIAHEIIEKNSALEHIALVGIQTRGEFLSKRLHTLIEEFTKQSINYGTLDVTFYRDDFKTHLGSPKVEASNILFDVENKSIILIDDVLYTGRTIRAAMDEIFSYGRPADIQLGILIDRGHRELPIKPDFVGKNYPTSINEHIHVHFEEKDNEDSVLLLEYIEGD